jgi:RimJ/RimL family protein N-acetyltransferase
MRQEFTLKDGSTLIVRDATFNDVIALNQMIGKVFGSTDQVLTSVAEFKKMITLELQLKRIKNYTEAIGKCIFVAEIDKKMVGTLDFWNGERKRVEHTGEFGMGVLLDYRNKGIGKCLIEVLLQWAKENSIIEKVKLGVFDSNARGIHLYKKMGFIEEGRKVDEAKTEDGGYLDVIEMYIKTI